MLPQKSLYQKAFMSIAEKANELSDEIKLRSIILDNPIKIKHSPECPFSYRELKFAEHLANGHRAKAIAEIEEMNARTVEAQLERLQRKCGVTTLAALVAFFMRNGWIK